MEPVQIVEMLNFLGLTPVLLSKSNHGELWWSVARPRGYKNFFMLNSTEHDFFPAHKR